MSIVVCQSVEATKLQLQLQVSFQQICSDVAAEAKTQLQGMALSFLPDLPATSRDQANDNIAHWAEAVVKFETKLKHSVDDVMQPGLYTKAATAAYNSVFQDPKLSRFPELLQHLSTGAIQHQMKEALMFAKPQADSMVKTALQQVYDSALPAAALQHVFTALKDSIGNCIVRHVFQSLKNTALFVPSGFQLEEDYKTRQLRFKYAQERDRYQEAGLALIKITNDFQHPQTDSVGSSDITSDGSHIPAAESLQL